MYSTSYLVKEIWILIWSKTCYENVMEIYDSFYGEVGNESMISCKKLISYLLLVKLLLSNIAIASGYCYIWWILW